MSGFFALERRTLKRAKALNPVGYKIGLELMVKCDCRQIAEVPIHFSDRTLGESKLNLREQLKYIQHLRRLLIFKYPGWSNLVQFAAVGATGTLVNLLVLTALARRGAPDWSAIVGGIGVSFLSNFWLNRRFTFSDARRQSALVQLLGFAAASALGLLTNTVASLWFRREFPALPIQVAAAAGVAAGMGFNYLTSRYLVFRRARAKAGEVNA
jgi:dolichol-phosphate mannosyltransferase